MVFPIVGGDGKPTGYEIDNSLRLNDGDSGYLTRAQSNGNQDKWTWSGWVKRSNTGAAQCLFATTDGSATSFDAKFDANDDLDVYNYLGGGFGARLVTNRKFRDPAAWYHIVIIYDSGNGTEADRLQIWVNGTRETSFSTTNYPSQNEDSDLNVSGSNFEIGRQSNGSQFFDGYMAEVHLLDGQAYDPTYFGETNDDGIWVPIEYTGGNYGTNGFYLPFDNKGKIHSISVVGNTHHETDQKKFGATSIYFDGSNDELQVNDLGQLTFDGDFTVEFFARMGDQGDTYATIINDVSNNRFRVNLGTDSDSTPNLTFYSATFDAHVQGSSDIGDNAWHHCAVVRDNGTIRIFVDGTQETTRANSGNLIDISGVLEFGTYSGSKGFTGYLDEIRISNIARYTANFTPPTAVFSDDEHTRLLIHSDSTDGNTTFTDSSGVVGGIGNDSSGNNNDLASTSINTQVDQTTDTPTNSFCTINSVYADDGNNLVQADFSDGGTKMLSTVDGWKFGRGTFLLEAGKWYVEVKATETGNGQNGRFGLQPSQGGEALGNTDDNDTFEGFNVGLDSSNTNLEKLDTGSGSTIFSDFTSGSIAMLAIDLDNNKMWIGRNGTWYNNNNASTTLSADNHDIALPTVTLGWVFGLGIPRNGSDNIEFRYNWGQPSFAIASGNSDANGYGNFEFPVPSGFLSCCTKNLAEQG